MENGRFSKSADTAIIENRLRNTQVGEMVTYDELSKLLGREVREFCYGNLRTALSALIKESLFFDCVSKQGYRRLDPDQATNASEHYRTRAKNAARRGLVHLQHVPFDGLTDEGKKKHLTMSAQLGAVELFSTTKATKKIETAVKDASHRMAIGETLKLFGG